MALSRGKQMLKASILPKKSSWRGMTAMEEAEWYIKSGLDKEGFSVKFISKQIGQGVFAACTFQKGDFLLEYFGERITKSQAEEREKTIYARNKRFYLYLFKLDGKEMCIDATRTLNRICRLVNDAPEKEANAKMRKFVIKNSSLPYLALFATRDIQIGEQILYDYGDHVENLYWRKKDSIIDWQSESDDDVTNPFSSDETSPPLKKIKMPAADDFTIVEDSCTGEEAASFTPIPEISSFAAFRRNSRRACKGKVTYTASDSEIADSGSDWLESEYDHSDSDLQDNNDCVIPNGKLQYNKQSNKIYNTSQLEDISKNLDLCDVSRNSQLENSKRIVELHETGEICQLEDNTQNVNLGNCSQNSQPDDTGLIFKLHGANENDQLEDISKNLDLCDVSRNSQLENSKRIVELHETGEICQLEDNTQNVNLGNCSQNSQLDDTGLIFELHGANENDQLEDISKNLDLCDVSRNSQLENSKRIVALHETGEICQLEDNTQNVNLGNCSQNSQPDDTGLIFKLHGAKENDQLEDISQNLDLCDVSRNSQLEDCKRNDDRHVAYQSDHKGQKPSRYCIYCHQIITGGKLNRHILRKHKFEEEVKTAMLLPKQLQTKFFEDKRREGMYQFNLKFMSKPTMDETDKEQFMRERKPKYNDSLRMCSGCKTFLSNRSFYKHKQSCSSLTADAMKPKLLACTIIHKDKEFLEQILNKFRTNEAGELCRTDSLIQQVGYRHFCLRRYEKGKKDEVRKFVMSEMRDLARLFIAFKSLSSETVTTEEMFQREHLSVLREAIEKMVETSEDGREKYGLKLTLNAIIQRTIKSLKGYYTETMQDDKYDETKKFQLAYSFRCPEMYSNARYQCISSSVDKARRPEQLPEEEELKKLKTFISEEIQLVKDNFEISKYAWLRSLVVCRLTLYNGRRGEEPSRMLLSQWEDAEDGVWLPSDQVLKIEDDAEKYLVGQFRLAYLHGKGRKFVPVLLPEDIIEPIQILVAQRHAHGIKENNIFLFGTKSSNSHCSGWHSVKAVCIQAQVKINATKNRHRISTIYASLDMSLEHQRIFLDHMGHEAAISRDNYQCPIGIKEVRIMGKLLNNIDKGTSAETVKLPEMLEQSSTPGKSIPPETPVGSRVEKKSEKVTWSRAETDQLKKVFQDFFTVSTSNTNCNSGCLPNKGEIIEFLKNHMPQCLKSLSMQTAYIKTRTKLFNERKTIRHNINRHQNKLI